MEKLNIEITRHYSSIIYLGLSLNVFFYYNRHRSLKIYTENRIT